jgi:Bifunctional DNA primase/polymerase, N-terminal/CHC2 zinc finger
VSRYGARELVLYPRTKRPIGRGWQDGQSAGARERYRSEHPDHNTGVLLGHGLVVLDVDVQSDGHVTLRSLTEQHGELPPTFAVITGQGGRHHYFASADKALPTFRLGAGLELRANGAQCAAPPSVHPNGRLYTDDPAGAPWGEFAALPRWIEARGPSRPPSRKEDRRATPHNARCRDTLLQAQERISPREYVRDLAGIEVGDDGKACCPFHDDRTPSLHAYADPADGWYCYGCGVGGDIYTFAALLIGIRQRDLHGRNWERTWTHLRSFYGLPTEVP